jgi:transglutaminase-like putative cysteine protease
MRFEISYRSGYRYTRPVRENLNAVRIKPTTGPRQRLDSFDLELQPAATTREHTDYFGTAVIEFDVVEPHDELVIEATMSVETDEPATPVSTGWAAVGTEAYRAAGGEYLLNTERPPADGSIDDLLAAVRGESPLASLLAASEAIPERFDYRTGSTFVGSTVADLLAGGSGVCQDFVHLGLMLLRELGLATRYVSGYLFTAPHEGLDSVEVETHAWLEALLPGRDGEPPSWVSVDPTNRGLAGATHVKIGHGRAYGDVPPIRGLYRGDVHGELDVRVAMHRVNGAANGEPSGG